MERKRRNIPAKMDQKSDLLLGQRRLQTYMVVETGLASIIWGGSLKLAS